LTINTELLSEKEKKVLIGISNLSGKAEFNRLANEIKLDTNSLNAIISKLRIKNIIREQIIKLKKAVLNKKRNEKELIERTLFEILIKNGGKIEIKALKKRFSEKEAATLIGYAKKDKLIKINKNKIELTNLNYTETIKDKIFNLINGKDKSIIISYLDKKIKKEIEELARRRVVTIREEKIRAIELTENGKKLIDKIKMEEELGALTEEDIKEERWLKKKLKRYNINSEPKEVFPGKIHVTTKYIKKLIILLEQMGFDEVEYDEIVNEFWNFDVLQYHQEHYERELTKLYTFKTLKTKGYNNNIIVEKIRKIQEERWGYKWSRERAKRLILSTKPFAPVLKSLVEEGINTNKFTIARIISGNKDKEGKPKEEIKIGCAYVMEDANFTRYLEISKYILSFMNFENTYLKPIFLPYATPALSMYVKNGRKYFEVISGGLLRLEIANALKIERNILIFYINVNSIMKVKGIEEPIIMDLKILRQARG